MKTNFKTGKVLFICMVICLCTTVPLFSVDLPTLDDLTKSVDTFSENLANSLPFNSTLGLNWSDAYVGKFFPSFPPHFGFGISTGFTTMDGPSISGLLEQFGGIELPIDFGGLPILGYTVEARIGGIMLPFDIGLKFGYLDFKPEKFEMDYLLVGGDIRYAIFEKGFLIIPKVSIGIGYNYLKGGISLPVGSGLDYSYDVGDETKTLGLTAPRVGLRWETSTLDFKAQASWSFFIITPYVGLGISNGISTAGYEVKTELTGDIDKEALKELFGIDVSETGISSFKDIEGWSMRAFGGLSVNLLVLKLDLTGMYNFSDSQYGVTFGVRFQL